MPRARSSSSSSALSAVQNASWVDWVVSILLVVAIVIVAVYLCNNPNRERTDDEESFFGSCGAHATTDEDMESFANGSSSAATVVSRANDLDTLRPDDIGCCLVHYNMCGHCQTFKPVWKSICNKVNGKVYGGKRIKMFECGDDQNRAAWQEVSTRFGIRGYPTILVNIGGKNAQWTEYTGSREALGEYLMSAH